MKENQTAVLDSFTGLRKMTDPLAYRRYSMNGPIRARPNSEFEQNDGNPFSKARTSLSYFDASDSVETRTDLRTELPELEICQKGMTHHIVKDICIDEGMPVRQSPLNKSINDDRSYHSIFQTSNGCHHYEATEGDNAVDCTKVVRLNECAVKVEGNGKLLSQEKQTLNPGNSPMEDTAERNGLEDSIQKSETNIDEISREKGIDDHGASSSEVEPKEDRETGNLHYKNKVESGNITLHFNSSIPVMSAGVTTNGGTEKGEVLDSNDADLEKFRCNNNSGFGKINEPCLYIKDGLSNGLATSCVESLCSKETIDETSHNHSTDDKEENLDSHSTDETSAFASRGMNTTHTDGQATELHEYKNERRDSSNDSALTPGNNGVGESSFSSASLIAYSGPIAFSGSLSLRSDSSAATSARSFAFPILQPEWNSSPVRMSKAENGHFRKHKGWRSGILCCRF